MLTCADINKVEMEFYSRSIASMLPQPRTLTVSYRYRYAWQKAWRERREQVTIYVDRTFHYFTGRTESDLVKAAVERKVRRWHWTDKLGRLRRVVGIEILSIPELPKQIAPNTFQFRMPMKFLTGDLHQWKDGVRTPCTSDQLT